MGSGEEKRFWQPVRGKGEPIMAIQSEGMAATA